MCENCRKKNEIWLRLYTSQEMDEHNKNFLKNGWFAEIIAIHRLPAQSASIQRNLLSGRTGSSGTVRHEEAWEYIRALIKFYSLVSADDIDVLDLPCLDEQARIEREMLGLDLPSGQKQASRNGFVYLLKSDRGLYKIGRALNPEDRLKTFTVKLPFRVEYELLISSDDYRALETELHRRFAHRRVEGEWFDLTDEDVALLRDEYDDK